MRAGIPAAGPGDNIMQVMSKGMLISRHACRSLLSLSLLQHSQ